MKISQSFIENFIAAVMASLITPIINIVLSNLFTGNWKESFNRTKSWPLLIIFFVVWGTIIIIRHRLKMISDINKGPRIAIISTPAHGWLNLGELTYADVIWIVQAPAPSPFESIDPLYKVHPNSIEVDTPPRCPKCKTELEETQRLFGGFIWRCIGCGFRKRNLESYYKEAERAERLARRHYERRPT